MKYVKPRGKSGVLQYVRRVPVSVLKIPQALDIYFKGQNPVRESLGTTDITEAYAKASIYNQQFERKVAAALSGTRTVALNASSRRVPNANDLGQIAKTLCDEMIVELGPTIIKAKYDDDAQDYLDRLFDDQSDENMELHRLQQVGSLKATNAEIALADEIIANSNYDAPKGSSSHAAILSAVREGVLEGKEGVKQLIDGKTVPSQSNSALINRYAKSQPLNGKPILLSEVIEFQNHKKDFSPKTIAKRTRALEAFVDVSGDKYIHAIERKDLIEFVEKTAERTIGNTGRPVTAQTVQSYVSPISSALDYAISRDWIQGPNPAAGIKIEAFTSKPRNTVTPDKQRFHDHQLEQLFSHPWFSGCQSDKRSYQPGKLLLNESRFWVPIVALYTGMRAAELGGLKITDVKFEPVPHFVIQLNEYRGVKSGEKRLVPMLDALQKLGFVEYLESIQQSGADRVFPDWVANRTEIAGQDVLQWSNGNIIRAFNRNLVHKLFAIPDNETRSPLSFHSLRGSFKKLMYETNQIVLANQVIGHKMEKLDQRYIGSIDVVELYNAFHKLDYAFLDIPSRANP